eukprot:3579283-Amphidinium_carterae.1
MRPLSAPPGLGPSSKDAAGEEHEHEHEHEAEGQEHDEVEEALPGDDRLANTEEPMELTQDVVPRYDLRDLVPKLRRLWNEAAEDKSALNEFTRLVLGLHIRFWHAPAARMNHMLKEAGLASGPLSAIAGVVSLCPRCRNAKRPLTKPSTKTWLPSHFNQYVQIDNFHLMGKEWTLVVDELF